MVRVTEAAVVVEPALATSRTGVVAIAELHSVVPAGNDVPAGTEKMEMLSPAVPLMTMVLL